MASTVIRMLREGLPSRMDNLIDHLMVTTEKTMGPINVIPVAPWQRISGRSSLEPLVVTNEISSTSVVNPTPQATSSVIDTDNVSQQSATRDNLNKLKTKLRQASSAFDRSRRL